MDGRLVPFQIQGDGRDPGDDQQMDRRYQTKSDEIGLLYDYDDDGWDVDVDV